MSKKRKERDRAMGRLGLHPLSLERIAAVDGVTLCWCKGMKPKVQYLSQASASEAAEQIYEKEKRKLEPYRHRSDRIRGKMRPGCLCHHLKSL